MAEDFEQYRESYAFDIPVDVLFEWLKELGWNQCGEIETAPLVEFHSASDSEDSWFTVCGYGDGMKTLLPEAIKIAYFAMQDSRKSERLRLYEALKKEFEPPKPEGLEG